MVACGQETGLSTDIKTEKLVREATARERLDCLLVTSRETPVPAKMLLLLLCVGLTLVGAHEEEECKVHTENFDVSKVDSMD